MLNPASGDRAFIAARVPHAGRMCLLEQLVDWDPQRVHCRTGTHRAADNPLRAAGRLGASCAIEYAAQAMALHGVLTARGAAAAPRPGLLAAVRELRLWVERLDTLEAALEIECTRLEAGAEALLYAFELRCAGRPVASGRAMVVHGDAVAGGDAE